MTEARRRAAAELRRRVEACERIWVSVHESPDGDSIGAALALGSVFRQLGKRVAVIRQPPFPAQYQALPGAGDMVDAEQLGGIFPPQMIVACDVGSFDRVGPVLGWVGPDIDVVDIDHHAGSTGPAEPCRRLDIVDPSVASTTMLVYYLVREAWPECLGADEATCLYVGLVTDTGCFRHSNTDAAALQVASELAQLGADVGHLAEDYMFRRRPAALRLLAEVLSTLEFHAAGRFATLALTRDMLGRTGAREDETEGFVNYASSLDGVHAAALFREVVTGTTRVSLRSSGFVNVALLAREFGGGGHANAAGLTAAMDLASARARVTAAALRHLDHRGPAAEGE